ncbi:cysteine desulfurase family protein [Rhodococcus sp. X156]|uniref:cysteine desulfurase family protein n=1 Tax=Rhodococcus sp. X156 TaxID=2499145 RepID=UPI000FDC71F1|nr:cysteine desulfurase family protein [Rhodococcus sp. X156]
MTSTPASATVYLDHAATTPMLPEAVAVVTEAMGSAGNAASLHGSGRAARRRVEESRELLAQVLGARPTEVIFTGGGTESDNLAIKGIYWSRTAADPRRRRLLVGAAEHHAVIDAAQWLVEHEGAVLTWLPVDAHGRVQPETLRAALAAHADDTALVSVMWANNEVGTITDVAALAEIAHAHGVPLHTDAVQAVGQLPVDFRASGADALTITGHKLGGPFGTGALLLGRDVGCVPLLHGGGHERDVRSGSPDVVGVLGLATAAEVATRTLPERAARMATLRDQLVRGVLDVVDDAVLNGDPSPQGRLPGNAHLTFPGCAGDSLLMLLDARGIECSTGSACTSGVAQPSHVLIAMGVDPHAARSSLRLSLGHTSTEADVHTFLDAIVPVVERARMAGLTSAGAARTAVRG